MRHAPLFRAIVLAALAAIGCTNGGEDRITGLSATGQVAGFVYVDANGSRLLDQGDDSLPGIRVRLVLKAGPDTGLVQVTEPNGFYRFRDVPVGAYSLRVDTSTFSDTLQVVKVDSASFTAAPTSTIFSAGLPKTVSDFTKIARRLPNFSEHSPTACSVASAIFSM